MLESLKQDIVHAFRTLGRRRGFTLVALLSLSFGVGGSSAIFSLVKEVLLTSASRVGPWPRSWPGTR